MINFLLLLYKYIGLLEVRVQGLVQILWLRYLRLRLIGDFIYIYLGLFEVRVQGLIQAQGLGLLGVML